MEVFGDGYRSVMLVTALHVGNEGPWALERAFSRLLGLTAYEGETLHSITVRKQL